MKVKNAKKEDLLKALEFTNREFDGNLNIKFNGENFRLSVKDSKKSGSRIGWTGRRVKSACWHAHGRFFDNFFNICPDAAIITLGKRIESGYGWDLGTNISNMCNCNK